MSQDIASLLDIDQAGRLIQEFIRGLDRESFLMDRKTQSAVLHQILILGEAAKRVSKAYRDQHPEIPWRQMAGMRDVLIHAYESVDVDEVWNTVNEEVPELLRKIEPLIPKK
ncbi:MAG: DUF86 domain-containing protein [Anaerolineales bacterium]|jgi:uncharacterized protein with HEPN domain